MAEFMSIPRPKAEVLVNDFVRSVYNWMCIGLALTGSVALYVSSSETILRLVFGNQLIFFGLIIGELALHEVYSVGAGDDDRAEMGQVADDVARVGDLLFTLGITKSLHMCVVELGTGIS